MTFMIIFLLQCAYRVLCCKQLVPNSDIFCCRPCLQCISLSPLCLSDQYGTNNATYQIPASSPE